MMGKPNRTLLFQRRKALRLIGLGLPSLALAACSPQARSTPAAPAPTATPFVPEDAPAASTATVPASTATLPPPRPTATLTLPAPTPTALPRSAVAIGKAGSYDPALLRSTLETMLDGLGGIGDVVKPGARVAIKVNLTGGAYWQKPGEMPATELFVTHPAVAGALAELLRDAGAAKIYIVEAVYEPESWSVWGYTDLVDKYGVELVDLNDPSPYGNFAAFPVGEKRQVYDTLSLHPLLGEIDTFVSLPKMKVHYTAGVTVTMKNLMGITPLSLYRAQPTDTSRSAIHGGFQDGVDRHLIRAILDENLARPIHLGIVDGVLTCEGGEGPWEKLTQVPAGVLLAGKDALAVDAVATAVMGFDPEADTLQVPFVRSENYLAMARELGMGTNRLSEIPVVGSPIEEVRRLFKHG